jgi:hypothetical protein
VLWFWMASWLATMTSCHVGNRRWCVSAHCILFLIQCFFCLGVVTDVRVNMATFRYLTNNFNDVFERQVLLVRNVFVFNKHWRLNIVYRVNVLSQPCLICVGFCCLTTNPSIPGATGCYGLLLLLYRGTSVAVLLVSIAAVQYSSVYVLGFSTVVFMSSPISSDLSSSCGAVVSLLFSQWNQVSH